MDSTGRLIPPPVLLGIAAAVVALGSCDRAVEPGPQDDVTAATAPEPEIHVFERLSPVCEACAIHMDPLGEFGNLDDEVLLRGLPRVERDGRGRFLAWVPSARDHEIIVYDRGGGVEGTVGAYGQGPGEFTAVAHLLVGPGDTIFVAHEDRVSMFDADRRLAGTLRLSRGSESDDLAVLSRAIAGVLDDGFVFAENRSGGSYQPLQFYDRSGSYVRSFGPPFLGARLVAGRPVASGEARSAMAASDAFWVVRSEGGYHLGEARRDGGEVRAIGVRAPEEWNLLELVMTREHFERMVGQLTRPGDPVRRGGDRPETPGSDEFRAPVRPQGVVRSLAELRPGLLAVAIHVPSGKWEEARATRAEAASGRDNLPSQPAFRVQLYDTVIDVIDTERAVVVARRNVPGLGHLTSDATFYTTHVDEVSGVISFRAWELDVEGW
jgi:hypothetical protein